MSTSLNLSNSNVLKYFYTEKPYFMVKCLYCGYNIRYVKSAYFWDHIKSHEEIMEVERQLHWFQYFDCIDKANAKCIICKCIVSLSREHLDAHVKIHSEQDLLKHKHRTIEFKYWIKIDNFRARCEYCNLIVNLNISPNLTNHIKTEHPALLAIAQEIQDVIGP